MFTTKVVACFRFLCNTGIPLVPIANHLLEFLVLFQLLATLVNQAIYTDIHLMLTLQLTIKCSV